MSQKTDRTAAGWTRPSSNAKSKSKSKSKSNNETPQSSNLEAYTAGQAPTRVKAISTSHRAPRPPGAGASRTKSSDRDRRVTPEERLAKERDRDRARRHAAAESKNHTISTAAAGAATAESRTKTTSTDTTRLKSETRLSSSKHQTRKKSSSTGNNQHHLPGTDTPPVSEEEYSSLPVQIQRKYFSDLERLHIAYSSVHQASSSTSTSNANGVSSANTQLAHRQYPQLTTPSTPHYSTLITTSYQHNQPRRSEALGVGHSQASFGDVLKSQAEAQWYNKLPDKVRHQLFSIEEQDVLSETLQNTHPLKAKQSILADRKASRATRHSRKPALPAYISSSDDSDQNHKSRRPKHSNVNMATSRKRSDTELPQYNRHSIIHRSNSPHGLPWDSSVPLLPAPKAPLLTTTHRRSKSFATLASASYSNYDASATASDPDAVYYRNPEARHKLRQYLASPQRFDEALTFGFPSESQSESPQTYNPRTDSANTYYDTSSSYMETPDLDDFRSYDTSDTGTDSPATPADADFSWRASKFNRVSIFGSLDTDSIPSFDLKFAAEKTKPKLEPIALIAPPLMPPPLMNREMTLRMTLTRPDLRANEEDMYGYSRPTSDEDPLALDQLPTPIEDVSGTRGAFAFNSMEKEHRSPSRVYEPSQTGRRSSKPTGSNGISRFFKKLRGH